MAKNVFISNNLPQGSVGLIPRSYSLDYNDSDAPLSKAELISRLKGKDGLICHIISTIDDEVLAAAPTLKVVANVAVGYNNIDVAAAKRRGVIVTNTPDVLTETTADFAWALLMAAARRVVEADRYARSGQWKAWKWDLLWGADVHGKTLGIVGFGRIGRAIARRAQGFNIDRKSTRLNSSHGYISYAVFCLKKKKDTAFSTAHKKHHTPLFTATRVIVRAGDIPPGSGSARAMGHQRGTRPRAPHAQFSLIAT